MKNTLGCVGCPCASSCHAAKTGAPGLGALGCSCLGCANAATCGASRSRALGFASPTLAPFEGDQGAALSLDFKDWKTWIIAALAALVLYQLLFTSEKRSRRSNRRAAFSAERDRYKAAMRKIREGK